MKIASATTVKTIQWEVLFAFVAIIGFGIPCCAQKIDNTAFYRDLFTARSLRVHYENDFFSRSDIYYTQGINVEYYDSALTKYLRWVMFRLPDAKFTSGVAVEHLGFTPTSISSSVILNGDRPFAACLMAKAFSVSINLKRKIQLNSTISLGIIGPGAGGRQFQSAIHRWINDRQPKGWNNQISNEIVLNYNAGIAKGLVDLRWLTVAGKMSADAGTLTSKLNAGFVVMTGLFNNRWSVTRSRKFQAYIYSEPIGSLIGYDATLQGGVFNDSSPYTIPATDVTRTVFQHNSGIVFVFQKFQVEYFQSLITKEFVSANSHHWGGIRLSLKW